MLLPVAAICFCLGLSLLLVVAILGARRSKGQVPFIDFVQLGRAMARLNELLDAPQRNRLNLLAGLGVLLVFASWLLVTLDLLTR